MWDPLPGALESGVLGPWSEAFGVIVGVFAALLLVIAVMSINGRD